MLIIDFLVFLIILKINLNDLREVIAMKIINIKWDTDGDKELLKTLPTEIDITEEFDFEEYGDGIDFDEDQLLDDVSNWLSETYGYCHFGFNLRR